MAESDTTISTYESDRGLSEYLGTKTLQARSMVSNNFRDNPIT